MFHHRDKAHKKDQESSDAPGHVRADDEEFDRAEEIEMQRRLQLEVESFEQGMEG